MTFSAVPFALQNSSHSADLFRQAVSSLIPPGGGIVSLGDLTVTQTGTPSMNVLIGVGRIWVPGTNVGNVVGGNFSSQAMYYGQNASAYTASVATSDPINPRIDVVYASIEDSQYAGATNAGKLAVVAGVPTSGATYPTNAPAIPANAKAIAWINVPANASSILNANITRITQNHVGPPAYSSWVTTDTNWSYGGGFVKSTVGPRTFIQLNGTMTRIAGGSFAVNVGTDVSMGVYIPAGYMPPIPISSLCPVTTGTVHNGEPMVMVGTDGTLKLHATVSNVTVAVGAHLSFSMGWYQ